MRQRIVRAVAWSATRTAGQAVVTFVVFMTLARFLEPKAFGLVAMAMVLTELLGVFQEQGFGIAIVQREKIDASHLDTAFWTSLVTGALLAICCMVVAGPVARFFEEPLLGPITRWLSVNLFFASLGSTPCAILRRSLRMKTLAIRSLASNLASGTVAVMMAVQGFGVWSLVARSLVASVTECLAVWLAIDWRPRLRFYWDQCIELLTFGTSIVGKRIVTVVSRRSDVLMIGLFLGPTVLGYYALAHKSVFMFTKLITGISGPVALPAFSRLQQDPKRLQEAFYEATRLTGLVAFPVFLGLLSVAPVFVLAFYGDRWAPSIPLVQILAIAGILQTLSYYHGSAMVAVGKPSWSFGVKLLSALANMIALIIAAQWGIIAMAWAIALSGYVVAPVSLLVIRRLIQIEVHTYVRQFVVPLLASLIMVGAVFGIGQMSLFFPDSFLQLAVLVLAGALTYVVVLQVTAPSLTAEMIALYRLIRPRPNET